MSIIDTPAEGFPLPIMTPPARKIRDVLAALSPGARAIIRQRAEDAEKIGSALRNLDAAADAAASVPADMFDREVGIGRNHPCVVVPVPVFDAEIERRVERMNAAVDAWAHPAPVVLTFADGRAYERGATLRRNVGAKSLGSRRVQAQGVASDYLRDDPQDGPRLAALVLAGFMGQDPETVR